MLSLIFSNKASPIPETFNISSILENKPCSFLYSTIDFAFDSPMPDNFVSSSTLALLIEILDESLSFTH